MKPLSLCSRLKPGKYILKQGTEGTAVLLTLQEGRYYALDDPGGRAWDWCDGQRTVADIAELLAEEYDAPREEIERDLLEFFSDLVNEDLLAPNPKKAESA